MAERAIDIDNNGVRLSGTLTLPDSPPPRCPAVLLVQGSGPTDRDGNQPPHGITNLLSGIAGALAGAGIASLRYDKRGQYRSAPAPSGFEAVKVFARFENYVNDARAAFTTLTRQPDIAPTRCGVLGHSEGGLIALHMTMPPVACVMLAATAARRVDLLLAAQIDALARRQGATEAQRAQIAAELRSIFDEIRRTETTPTTISPGLRAFFPPYLAGFQHQIADIDPLSLAARAAVPMAIIQGGADAQVSPTDDAEPLRRALPKAEFTLVDGLDHNLNPVGAKEPGASPAALQAIARWFAAHL